MPASCSCAGRTCSRATGPTGAGGPDADGWFRTTDIAAYDDDGDLQLIGRTTDLVIVSGFNVYPAEVESVLRAIDGHRRGRGHRRAGRAHRRGGRRLRRRRARASVLDEADGAGRAPPDRWPGSSCRGRSTVVASLPHTITGKVMKWQHRGLSGCAAADHQVTLITRTGLPPVRRGERHAAPTGWRTRLRLRRTRRRHRRRADARRARGVRRSRSGDPDRRPGARLLAGRRGAVPSRDHAVNDDSGRSNSEPIVTQCGHAIM